MRDTLEHRSRSAPAWLLPAVLLTFVIGLLPFTADYLLHHPDERHYADAGIRMLETGDYLTPRTAAGELRLKKPILPYWCVLAGYQLAGVSPLGARLGFLLCGAAVVGLAWWGGWIAFGSRAAASFAAFAAMTQPALLISAPRSVPDVCLALGIQLSVCGFLLILRSGRATATGLTTAVAGGVIAVLSKGLPAAAFVGYAVAFLAWRTPALLRSDWRRWLTAGAIGLAVSGSWFALMAARHPDLLVQQFSKDQLGPHRFAAQAWQPALQFPMCLGLLAAMSAPWWIAASLADGRWPIVDGRWMGSRRARRTGLVIRQLSFVVCRLRSWRRMGGDARHGRETGRNVCQETGRNVCRETGRKVCRETGRNACRETGCNVCRETGRNARGRSGAELSAQLLLGWAVVYCGLAATINHITPRYLLPAAAPLSIVIGGALAACDAEQLRRTFARAGMVCAALLIAGVLLVAVAVRRSQPDLLPCAVVLATLCGAAAISVRRWNAAQQALLIAVVMHVALFAGGTGVSIWRGAGLAGLRAMLGAEPSPRVVIGGEAAHASQLRVALGSTTRVVDAATVTHIEPTDVLVLDAERAAGCELPGCRLSYVAAGYRVPEGPAIVRAVIAGDLPELLRAHERRFIVAVPDAGLRPVVQQASATMERGAR